MIETEYIIVVFFFFISLESTILSKENKNGLN